MSFTDWFWEVSSPNMQGFDSKSRTLTHFVVFEEHMAGKAILSVSSNRREVSCWRRCTACNSLHLHEENQLRFSNSKHFHFYSTKKHFISEWYFPKNHEIGSLAVRKVKKSWDSRQNRELGPAYGVEEQLLIASSCLSPGRLKKLPKFISFCLKVGHSANLKHSNSTWSQLIVLWKVQNHPQKLWAQCTLTTSWSRNGKDRSTTVVVLILGVLARAD